MLVAQARTMPARSAWTVVHGNAHDRDVAQAMDDCPTVDFRGQVRTQFIKRWILWWEPFDHGIGDNVNGEPDKQRQSAESDETGLAVLVRVMGS